MLLPWMPGSRDFHARDCAGWTALMLHDALENSSHLPLPACQDRCLTQAWPGCSTAKSGISGFASRIRRTRSFRNSAIIGAVSREGKMHAPDRPGRNRATPRRPGMRARAISTGHPLPASACASAREPVWACFSSPVSRRTRAGCPQMKWPCAAAAADRKPGWPLPADR